MRITAAVLASLLAASCTVSDAFTGHRPNAGIECSSLRSSVAEDTAVSADAKLQRLTTDIISKLRFREAQRELEALDLEKTGTLSAMKGRLRSAIGAKSDSSLVSAEDVPELDEEALNKAFAKKGIEFYDDSDPDFEFKELVKETLERAEKNHWKGATRKLKRLTRRFGKISQDSREIPEEVYAAVLRACADDRLHGARAAESARKVMELMADDGYGIPAELANSCIQNCISDGPHGTHDGFGGVDCALAMKAALEATENPPVVAIESRSKVIIALARDGSLDDSLAMLRSLVAEQLEPPPLSLFADVAQACVAKDARKGDAEKVFTVLAYAKTAGFDLDTVASTIDGRSMLAAGVIAAAELDNLALGLRLLTAASKASGCDPDTGDALVANASPAAQRACTIIHRRAILKAATDGSWKLAVKLLSLKLARGLTPSPRVLSSVISCCANLEKSRKATSLLLDWVDLAKQGRADKPSLRVFNTVVNACEVCGEEELTIKVLDAMKETHDTDGNIITFNIALKRLAKQGNTRACEGIIIGMLQNEIEPSVVSYTTAIAACVSDPKQSELAIEWIKRMRTRRVQPNVITYNTAFASCLDGTLAGSSRASSLAAEMMADIQQQVDSGVISRNEYTNIIPNFYTRTLARQAMKQLKQNWEEGLIDRKVAKTTLRVPLLQLVEFMKTELASNAEQQREFIKGDVQPEVEEEDEAAQESMEEELEYSAAISSHRAAAV